MRVPLVVLSSLVAWIALVAPVRAAPAGEPIAPRVQACTACHGSEDRTTPHGYFPRIDGKPAGYLHQQLLNFRDGRRRHAVMSGLLQPLSDDYLREIAEHFAARPPSGLKPQAVAAAPSLLERGRRLVEQGDAALDLPACTRCHGAALTGVAPALPGLLGLPRDYLNAQLGQWRSGQRRAREPDCMARIARRLADDDIAAVSAWLAAQPLPPDPRPAAALPASLPLDCGGIAPPPR